MRIAVLTGLLACAIVFGLSSSEASAATPVDMLDINTTKSTAVEEILAVAQPEEEPKESSDEPKETIHIVAENESLAVVAEEYNTTWQRLFYKNTDIETPDVITEGMELVIPEDNEKLKERDIPQPEPVQQATTSVSRAATTSSVQSTTTVARGSSSGNGYVAGYCTWYVKNRRPDLPNTLGNGYEWFGRAQAQGLSTGYTARAGAVAQRNNHVAYVEKVHGDGTMTISDMNYRNLYEKTVRRVSISEWRFIY